MNANNIANMVSEQDWWVEIAPVNIQNTYSWFPGFVNASKFLGVNGYKHVVLIIKDTIVYEMTLIKEQNNGFYEVLEKQKKDSNFMDKKFKEWSVLNKKFNHMCEKVEEGLTHLTNDEFIDVYTKYLKAFQDEFACFISAEHGDEFVNNQLLPIMKKKYPNVAENELANHMSSLSMPSEMSFMQEEKESFLILCKLYINKDASFEEELIKHSNNFFWVNNNYKNSIFITPQMFKQRVIEYCKDISDVNKYIFEFKSHHDSVALEKEKSLEQLNLDDELSLIFYVLKNFGKWIDTRKKNVLIGIHYMMKLVKEASNRSDYSLNELKYVTPDELKDIINGKNIDRDIIKKRKELVVLVDNDSELLMFSNKDAKSISDAYFSKKISSEIKGFVASAPLKKIQGTVQIIMDPYEEIFEEGKILITSMTRPEFVPIIKKAKAIVTDEGGITSHAAIVSRELKIPCIVGTGNGTKILIDGDEIELDLETGFVQIIN